MLDYENENSSAPDSRSDRFSKACAQINPISFLSLEVWCCIEADVCLAREVLFWDNYQTARLF